VASLALAMTLKGTRHCEKRSDEAILGREAN
jgi:hypothetical protein